MLAVALPLVPSIRRAIIPTVYLANQAISRNISTTKVRTSATDKVILPQTTIMAETIPQQNPMPVLSEAAPADPVIAQELPKLSTEDFRIYNRLAIMMDAYVSNVR